MNVKTYSPKTEWHTDGFAPITGAPNRIVVHRTGNPDADGDATMSYFDSSRKSSVHAVIDRTHVLLGPAPNRQAWHVLAYKQAAAKGFAITNALVQAGRDRGDINAFGIEVVEHWTASAKKDGQDKLTGRARDEAILSGGATTWPDDTVETLVEFLTEWTPHELGTLPIFGHSEFDPAMRSHDPDGIMTPSQIRQRVSMRLALAGGERS